MFLHIGYSRHIAENTALEWTVALYFCSFFFGGETRIGDWPGIRSGLRIIQLLSVVVSFCMVKGYAFALLLSPPGIGIKADDQTSKYKKTNATKPPVR